MEQELQPQPQPQHHNPHPSARKQRFFLVYLFGIVVGFVILALIGGLWVLGELTRPFRTQDADIQTQAQMQTQTITIPKGVGVRGIITELQNAKFITHPIVAFGLQVYVVMHDWERQLKFGQYIVEPDDSLVTLMERIAGGDAALEATRVAFPEGFTKAQVIARLRESGFGKVAADLANEDGTGTLAPTLRQNYPFLPEEQDEFLEGYLFPDTYNFDHDATTGEVLGQLLDNTRMKLETLMGYDSEDSLRADDAITVPGLSRMLTLHEFINIASLIEKEVRSDEDRRLVAGIIVKRLEREFPLQLDASINYVTGKGLEAVTLADTRIDSPYNTYQRVGLPIGPISNPGVSSLRAVLEAQESSYFYYLTGLDGRTYYATSFEEHAKNKAKYR